MHNMFSHCVLLTMVGSVCGFSQFGLVDKLRFCANKLNQHLLDKQDTKIQKKQLSVIYGMWHWHIWQITDGSAELVVFHGKFLSSL